MNQFQFDPKFPALLQYFFNDDLVIIVGIGDDGDFCHTVRLFILSEVISVQCRDQRRSFLVNFIKHLYVSDVPQPVITCVRIRSGKRNNTCTRGELSVKTKFSFSSKWYYYYYYLNRLIERNDIKLINDLIKMR